MQWKQSQWPQGFSGSLGKEAEYLEWIWAHASHAFSNNTREGAKDQNGIEPLHLAKGVVTEARGEKMEQGQVGLA